MANIILGFILIGLLVGCVYLNEYLDAKAKSKFSMTESIRNDIYNFHYKYRGCVDTIIKTTKDGRICEATLRFHYTDPKLKKQIKTEENKSE